MPKPHRVCRQIDTSSPRGGPFPGDSLLPLTHPFWRARRTGNPGARPARPRGAGHEAPLEPRRQIGRGAVQLHICSPVLVLGRYVSLEVPVVVLWELHLFDLTKLLEGPEELILPRGGVLAELRVLYCRAAAPELAFLGVVPVYPLGLGREPHQVLVAALREGALAAVVPLVSLLPFAVTDLGRG